MNTANAWALIEQVAVDQGVKPDTVSKWRQRRVPHNQRKLVADAIEVMVWRAFDRPPAREGNSK